MTTVTLITPTGGRPDAFKLCERWIKRQVFRGTTQWLVIDDTEPATVCTHGQVYLRGPRDWSPGVNTHRFNMELALSKVEGDYVLIIEDDDYYSPHYVDQMVSYLRHANAVGIGQAKYYHVGVPGHKTLKNYTHAALSQTGFRKELVPNMLDAVNSGDLFIDRQFWGKILDKTPNTIVNNSLLAVGIKGLPGRPGITESHRQKRDYHYDANYAKIREWLGADHDAYIPYMRKGILSASTKGKTETLRPSNRVMPQQGGQQESLQKSR